MFKVRDINSSTPFEEIHADDYKKSDASDLRCPCCSAHMIYVRESNPSSAFARSAHFRTALGDQHDDDCKAVTEEKYIDRISKTITEALDRGDMILLSLNDLAHGFGLPKNLDRTFNGVSDPAYLQSEVHDFKTRYRGHYKQESINSIFALMTILNLIDREKGPPVFNRIYMTWRGQILPYDKFVLSQDSDVDLDKELFRDIYAKADNKTYPHRFEYDGFKGAYGFPRIVEFRPTKSKRSRDKDTLFGPCRLAARNPDNKARLSIEHTIDIRGIQNPAVRERLASGHVVRLLATPRINATYARRAFQMYEAGCDDFVRITWAVSGDHQIQILRPDLKLSRPLPQLHGPQRPLL